MTNALSVLTMNSISSVLGEGTKLANSHLQRQMDYKIHSDNMLAQSNMLKANVAMTCAAETVKAVGSYLQYKAVSNQAEQQHQAQMAKLAHDTERMQAHYDAKKQQLEQYSKSFASVMQNIDNNSIDEQLNELAKQSSAIIAKMLEAQSEEERNFFKELYEKVSNERNTLLAMSSQNSNNAITAFKELGRKMNMHDSVISVDDTHSNMHIIEGEWQ